VAIIYTGEVCVYCGRPILVDEKSSQVGRCRTCKAPYHTRCWFAANEKCVVPGCEGKAADVRESTVASVGDVCPFLPPTASRREGGDPVPAKCLKTECALFDAAEGRCGLGEVAYVLGTVRQNSRDTRRALNFVFKKSAQRSGQQYGDFERRFVVVEGQLKNMTAAYTKQTEILANVAQLLGELKEVISDTSGERVRTRRDARLAARAALRDGRPGAAVQILQSSLKRGADEAVTGDLATAYVHAERVEDAVELLDGILERNPDNTPSRITMAALQLQAGDAAAAEDLLKDAPQPANAQLRAELAYARACVAYAVGRSEDAVAFLNEALDEDPWHSDASEALFDLRAKRTGTKVPDAAGIAVQERPRG
jgi:tetratricopeptide (TPR) repeat protein